MIEPLSTEQLLARLATVVGAEHVAALAPDSRYGGLLHGAMTDEQRPRAVVQPASAEQLQRLAPMIAELGHGLWSAANGCGNGAQAGHRRKPGVLVDLRRMNRIVEVDRQGGCAVIEAGVSYAQLADHLRERELPLWLDADANGEHAIAGSVAARHWGVTPYGDHLAAQCGLEVVLATGALLRTGMGAVAGSACWPRYKYNFGPALDGLFSRAHLGVVTRLGLWLMPTPRRVLPFTLPLPDLAALAICVERLAPLLLDGSVSGRPLLASRASDAALLARSGLGEAPPDAPPWTLHGALYGLPEGVEYHWQSLSRALPGVRREGSGPLWQARLKQMHGEAVYGDASGADASALSFGLLAPPTARDVQILHHAVLTRLADQAPRLSFQLAPRLLALEVELDPRPDAHEDARNAALAAVGELVKAGYGLRHACPELDDILAARHTPPGLRRLGDGLATALDPYATLAARGKFKRGKR